MLISPEIIDYCRKEIMACETKIKRIKENKHITISSKSYSLEMVCAEKHIYEKLLSKEKGK